MPSFEEDREEGVCKSNQDCVEPNLDMQYLMGIARYAHTSHHYFDDIFEWAIYMVSLSSPPMVATISYGYTEDQLRNYYPSYLESFNTEAAKLALRFDYTIEEHFNLSANLRRRLPFSTLYYIFHYCHVHHHIDMFLI